MKIEIINSLNFAKLPRVAQQINDVKKGKSDELWLATPHSDAHKIISELGLNPSQVFDIYTQSYFTPIDETKGIWWTDLDVPVGAQIVVNQNWTKSVALLGHEIARVNWYEASQRIVSDVDWLDNNQQIDYKDVYRRDGSLFSRQYYSENSFLQIDFYNKSGSDICVRECYFQGKCNFVLANNQKFQSPESYIAAVGNRRSDTVFNIAEMGREIHFAPKHTQLSLLDSVLDDNSRIYGNLETLLKSDQDKISNVLVSASSYEILKKAGLPLNKVSIAK